MVYKQHRFNLQREETEGFAKLLVLVAGVRDGGKAAEIEAESEENMRRLIGYFDLDPNRCGLLAWPVAAACCSFWRSVRARGGIWELFATRGVGVFLFEGLVKWSVSRFQGFRFMLMTVSLFEQLRAAPVP